MTAETSISGFYPVSRRSVEITGEDENINAARVPCPHPNPGASHERIRNAPAPMGRHHDRSPV